MDDTSQKIIDAAMVLIRDKGYVATTTKDIAGLAEVNECTLFRKFKNKKDIVLSGIAQDKWRGNVTKDIFEPAQWELQKDLELFMSAYLDRITPDFVKLSVGLRAPQIYEETAPYIMQIPQTFLSELVSYFKIMEIKGKIVHADFESLAMTVFASAFGFTFLQASFGNELSKLEKKEFIKNSVQVFVNGIDR